MNSTITGRVFVHETGQGIPHVIVTAYDVGQIGEKPEVVGVNVIQQKGSSLGSASTAEDGSFAIEIGDFQAAEKVEMRLAAVVSAAHTTSDVQGEEPAAVSQVLAFTSQPRSGVGAQEAFVIGISQKRLAAVAPLPGLQVSSGRPGITKKRSSAKSKEAAIQRLQAEMVATQRFVPIRKERLQQPNYALSGKALEIYERARKHDANLPDLSLKTVQAAVIDQTIQRLQNGYQQIVSALKPKAEGKGNAEPDLSTPDSSDSDVLIPPTMRINLAPQAAQKIGLEPEQGGNGLVETKFRNVRHIVPPVSLTAPSLSTVMLNYFKAAPIKANMEHVLADLRSLSTNSGNGVIAPLAGDHEVGDSEPDLEDEDTAIADVERSEREWFLLEKINGLLDKIGQQNAYGQVDRQSGLYESLNTSQNALSAADTTAYYDFYSLKISWETAWVDPPQEAQNIDIPPIIHSFLPELTLDEWQRYVLAVEPSQRTILRAANEYQVWVLLVRMIDRAKAIIKAQSGSWSFTPEEQKLLQEAAEYAGIDWQSHTKNIGNSALEEYSFGMFPGSFPSLDELRIGYANDMTFLQDTWSEFVQLTASAYQGSPTMYAGGDPNYDFKLFTPDSVNYGLLINYRQRWKPLHYQVGDLIKTIPLAPKESVKVSTRVKVTKKRARKEIENSMEVRRGEDSMASRAESEIVERAQQKTNFEMNAKGHVEGGIGIVGGSVDMSTAFSTAADRDSAQTKKNFREAVTKAAREFKNERTIEVSTEETFESEYSTTNELSNPNEEITVTYLYYELQRLYEVSEWLHGITSVVLIANDVPDKSEIGDEGRDWPWIRNHAWILRRVLLDDSFLPALEYVMEGKKALDEKLQVLKDKKDVLQKIINKIQANIEAYAAKQALTDQEAQMYTSTIASLTGRSEGFFENLGESIFGGDEGTQIRGIEVQKEEALRRLQQIVQQMQALRDEMVSKQSALDRAVDDYHRAKLENDQKLGHVRRLVNHLQQFILYYMQAIWSHEPPDQRYLRLSDIEVPFIGYPEDDDDVIVRVRSLDGTLDGVTPGTPVDVVIPTGSPDNRPLRDIADLNTLLGFKGNYMIFPLRVQSDITAKMAYAFVKGVVNDIRQDQDEPAPRLLDRDSLGVYDKVMVTAEIPLQLYATDPDINYTSLNDIKQVWQALLDRGLQPGEIEVTLKRLLEEGLLDDPNSEEIIVPTNSLYIEALPGRHPILEDFKLRHRQIDALKADAERRGLELDNVRAEARLWAVNLEDPKVDKRIVVESDNGVDSVVD